MQRRVKQFLFLVLMLLLLLPNVQQHLNWPKMKNLKGAISKPKLPQWSWKNLWTGSFQDSLNTYVENNIGYRPDLVRLHNQLQYTLFDTVNAQAVVVGKDGYLFEMNYIKALYGIDFVGEEKIIADVEKTIFVDQWLRKNGKALLVVLAPGKASFFPEFVPDKYRPDTIKPTNHDRYYELLSNSGVAVIGGNQWFAAMKDTSRYALFPKCGIHWSYYGLGLVFDSVFTRMEHLLGRKFVDFEMNDIVVTDKLRSPDRDLWDGMNLIQKPDDYPMPYPKYVFNNPIKDSMPSVVTVADSYYWQWFGGGYTLRSFRNDQFWYYNAQALTPDNTKARDRKHLDLFTEVSRTDLFMILQTDANMNRYGFGLIDELYEVLIDNGAESLKKAAEIAAIIDGIRASDSYMLMVREKAAARGISEEEMLRLDAGWVWENRQKTQAKPD